MKKKSEIWADWLQFESNSGNLNTIMKVIELRNQTYEELNQLEDRQTSLIIDRYKFLNLYPCSLNELKLIGYNESCFQTIGNTNQSVCNQINTASLINTLNNNLNINNDEMATIKNDKTSDLNAHNPFSKLASKKLTRFPVPDVNKMLPFKPNRNAFSGLQPIVGGGLFLFPSCFADMIKRLPPPQYFDVSFNHFFYVQRDIFTDKKIFKSDT